MPWMEVVKTLWFQKEENVTLVGKKYVLITKVLEHKIALENKIGYVER